MGTPALAAARARSWRCCPYDTAPTKHTRADFLKSDYWRLRDKFDVPKEAG